MRPSIGSNGIIWFFAFMYFACYVPFSGLTKALSEGTYPGMTTPVAGAALLPIATMMSLVVMLVFLSVMGWWKYAGTRRVLGRDIPFPSVWTALSGLCTSVILTTTTLAYTFDGVSIVFMMLLMRGGVLIIAPTVDAMTGRPTRWFSWVGLGFSMAALVAAFADKGGYEITIIAIVDLTFYLAAYLIRLRLMSRRAKSADTETTLKYFVEEQLVTTPSALLILGVLALIGQGGFMEALRDGFTTHFESGLVIETLVIGLFSQGAGIFGTLVFLDKRENTFSVPVNRASSILAGVTASFVLALWLDAPYPSSSQLLGAGLVTGAIVALSVGPMIDKRRKARAAASQA